MLSVQTKEQKIKHIKYVLSGKGMGAGVCLMCKFCMVVKLLRGLFYVV